MASYCRAASPTGIFCLRIRSALLARLWKGKTHVTITAHGITMAHSHVYKASEWELRCNLMLELRNVSRLLYIML